MRRLIVLCAVLVGCSAVEPAPPDPGPVFDNEGAADVSCLQHQPQPPGARYTDDRIRRTDEVLPVLRYYTAHGRKPFCDGKPPSPTDRSWAELYVRLGADRANVATLLT
ncbi:hypothetical protein ACQPW3_11655 [Actinosynnema sp. CA-248983]